jgi:hypothetical protein
MRTEWHRLKNLHQEKTFIQIPKWLLAMKLPISGDALLLLAYMSDHCDDYDPGIKQISDETGHGQKKIKRLFNELVNVGMVCRTAGGSDGTFKTFRTNIHSMYFLADFLTNSDIYGPFPACPCCGYFPRQLQRSPKSVPTNMTDTKLSGSPKSVPTKLSGSPKSVPTSSPKSGTTNQTRPDKKLTRQEEGEKSPPPSKPKKTTKTSKPKKPPSEHSMKLAHIWWEKRKHPPASRKDKMIPTWAAEFDTAKRLTGYSDEQMEKAIIYACKNEFWLYRTPITPQNLHKPKDGTRKIITIYNQAVAPPRRSQNFVGVEKNELRPKRPPSKYLAPDENMF